jgi:uncharacterized membrane protein (UPF0127 family)
MGACDDRRVRIVFVLLLIGFTACSSRTATTGAVSASSPPHSELTIHARSGALVLQVNVATSDRERQQGLMGVTALPNDQGEVFVWSGPTLGGFWMKDTLIPLSIAFWDKGGRIVGMLDMAPCHADPCPIYHSPAPYVGAVEVNRGYLASHGVAIGDRVELRQRAHA